MDQRQLLIQSQQWKRRGKTAETDKFAIFIRWSLDHFGNTDNNWIKEPFCSRKSSSWDERFWELGVETGLKSAWERWTTVQNHSRWSSMMIDFSLDQSGDQLTNDSRLQVAIWMRNMPNFSKDWSWSCESCSHKSFHGPRCRSCALKQEPKIQRTSSKNALVKQENQNTYILRQDLGQSVIASQSDMSQVFHYNKCKQSAHIRDNQNISKWPKRPLWHA